MRRKFYELFPATSYLLLVNVAFFGLSFIAHVKGTGSVPNPLFGFHGGVYVQLGAVTPTFVESGEYWRAVSYAFLHGGLIHLAFNMAFLFSVGHQCESILSSWRFLLVYLVCGIAAGVASFFVQRGFSVGASGALCGMVGVSLGRALRYRDYEAIAAIRRWVIFMIALVLVPLPIDHVAHLGGFLCGAVFGWFSEHYTASATAAKWRRPGIGALVVLVVCLGRAVLHYLVPEMSFGGWLGD